MAGPHKGWNKLLNFPNLSLSGVKFVLLFWYLPSILSPFSVFALKGAEDRKTIIKILWILELILPGTTISLYGEVSFSIVQLQHQAQSWNVGGSNSSCCTSQQDLKIPCINHSNRMFWRGPWHSIPNSNSNLSVLAFIGFSLHNEIACAFLRKIGGILL